MLRKIEIIHQKWPTKGVFRIARSSLTSIETIIVRIREGDRVGRGECRPYSRYKETPRSVHDQILSISTDIKNGLSRSELQTKMAAGGARNAVDCALWDLESKQKQKPVTSLLNLAPVKPRKTAFTLSVDTPVKMAAAAKKAAHYPLLKVKIGGLDGLDSISAIMKQRPDVKLIVDANEAIAAKDVPALLMGLQHKNIVLIEQPTHADLLFNFSDYARHYPPICADEAFHNISDLDRLWALGYRAVNVKLDKTGGLTEAHQVMKHAKNKGFRIMAGCMAASSLAMAPMQILESYADFIDLDGPLLLTEDMEPAIVYDGPIMYPAQPKLWGY